MLFSPGNVEKMLVKANSSKSQIQILDLEDSVPISNKIEARETVAKFLRLKQSSFDPSFPSLVPRVNNTEILLKDDIDAVCLKGVWGITVGKIDSASRMLHVISLIEQAEAKNGLSKGDVKVLPWIGFFYFFYTWFPFSFNCFH